MATKKPLGTLQPISSVKPKTLAVPADEAKRGSVQTVRMDRATLKALKDACFERDIKQQDLMLSAIRRDLGLE